MSVLVGLLGVATIPVAVLATRWSRSYELLESGYAIPGAVLFGIAALALVRRASRRDGVAGRQRTGSARVGWVLGVLALCIAASATIALIVYGVLTYLGDRG